MVSFSLVVGASLVFVRPLYAVLSFVRVVGPLFALVSSFAFGGGFGRFAFAVLSSDVSRGSAPCVDWPSRNVAKKCDVPIARSAYLNRIPLIPDAQSGHAI